MVNVDKDPTPAQKYGVGSLPAILFLDAKGKVVHSFLGFVDVDGMLKEMKTALSKGKKK